MSQNFRPVPEKIQNSQTLETAALNFDPTHKDLIRITDPQGHPMGKYIDKPVGVRTDSEGRAHFTFYAPHAGHVEICGLGGAFGHRISMEKQADGTWTAVAEGLPAGFHYHDYIVDGTRMCSDLAPVGYGAFRCINYFELPEEDSAFYLLQDVPHGTIRMDYYESGVTGRTRICFVYTPPGYETHPEKRYPVLYLQHGGGESETGWIWQGKVNYILDNLIAEGSCREMIVVMNDGYAFRPDGSEHRSRGCIDEVITRDCIPFIDRKYRTLANRRARAVAGLSMGGFQAQSAALRFPDQFASVGLFSCYLIINDGEDDYTSLFMDSQRFNRDFDLFFFSTGDREENFYSFNLQAVEQLRQWGVNVEYFETPGYHEWQVWRHSLRAFLQKLFPETALANEGKALF